jgi:hypothetical protein
MSNVINPILAIFPGFAASRHDAVASPEKKKPQVTQIFFVFSSRLY